MTGAWRLRPASSADLPDIIRLGSKMQQALLGFSDAENLTRVREQIAADPAFTLEADAIIATTPDGVTVGSALLNPHSARISVDPDRDDPGLRTDLLAWSEQRQREIGRDPVRCAANPVDSVMIGLLTDRGYVEERFYASMARDFSLTGPPLAAALPAGYTFRPVDRDRDARELYELDERAFSVLPDYEPEEYEAYVGRHLRLSDFAPEWSLVVHSRDGAIAGSLIGTTDPGRPHGFILVLAVDPAHQRRGLGRALLLKAFAVIHAAGRPSAELFVASDNPRALDLYTSVGMAERRRVNHYRQVT